MPVVACGGRIGQRQAKSARLGLLLAACLVCLVQATWRAGRVEKSGPLPE